MKFAVELTARAVADLEEAYLYIRDDSSSLAVSWRIGLVRACDTLAQFPKRCPIAPESAYFRKEVRQIFYGSYRIDFTIDGKRVVILHIRHAARLPLGVSGK